MIKGSVIIPSHNKLSRLELILNALTAQNTDEIEVLVILDGCTEEVKNALLGLNLPDNFKFIICEKNVGRAGARNIGVQNAVGEILIFMDDDLIPEADFIRKHLRRQVENSVVIGEIKQVYLSEDEIGEYSQKKYDDYIQTVRAGQSDKGSRGIRNLLLQKPNSSLRWFAFLTGNVSIPKDVMEKINGFDENFSGWGWEDIELGYRLYKCDVPFVKDFTLVNYHIEHPHNLEKIIKDERRNFLYFYEKLCNDFFSKCLITMQHLLFRFLCKFKTYY